MTDVRIQQSDLDAVGDVIRKKKQASKLKAKFMGWLGVVAVLLGLILLFAKTAN